MNRLLHLAYALYRLSWRVTRPTVVGVRTILIRDGQILLVRHTYQHHWYFPGGAVKRGESLAVAARREAHEEAGVTVTGELRLHGMYWSLQEGKNDHIGVFVSTDFSIGEALDRWEIADCRWFPVDAPPAELSPACARRLAELRRGEGPYVDQW